MFNYMNANEKEKENFFTPIKKNENISMDKTLII